MSCERFRPALTAHAAGAALEPAAERHLGECAACRQLLDTQARLLAELDAELGRSLSIDVSPGFAANVARSALEAGSAPERRWIPATLWASLAAAAVIVLAVWIRQPDVSDPTRRADVRLSTEAAPSPATTTPEEAAKPAPVESRRPSPAVSVRAATTASRPETSSPHAAAAMRRSADVEPPVIVEPERALAIQRLRELMTQGRLDEKMLPPPVTPEAALAELTIAPLEVAEIRVPDVEIVSRPTAAPQRQ